ncbi:MAG: sensor with HAMP domain protein, partial [Deltaproteobacteria bacterium]|nr:sensor with HAMP domain protein [Candidatus Anaeroferrophillacea bacterium]
ELSRQNKALEENRASLEQRVKERTASLKAAKDNAERLVVELETALDRIKTLRGLLPICANCKRIRDDKGYWHQVEAYIKAHAEVDFSHGICPECYAKLYPELINNDNDTNK